MIHIVAEPEQKMQRLRVDNNGAAADFVAMGRILEHEGGTPWPIQWRNTDGERQPIFKGGQRILNIASGEIDNDGKQDIRFFTASQPYRSGRGVSIERQSLVSRDFLLSALPSNVISSNVITLEVSITANPSMETQPCRTVWQLIRGVDDLLELIPAG